MPTAERSTFLVDLPPHIACNNDAATRLFTFLARQCEEIRVELLALKDEDALRQMTHEQVLEWRCRLRRHRILVTLLRDLLANVENPQQQ
jgi:hypothetical protein